MDNAPRFPDRDDSIQLFPSSTKKHDSGENGKLHRQQSFQSKTKGVLNASMTRSPKLSRTSTFHISPSENTPSFLRSGIPQKTFSPKSNSGLLRKGRESQVASDAEQSRDEKNLKRSTSRGATTENERKERKRRQNTESARRARERKRNEMERLEKAYDANELRIKELELMADELSRELRRHNTISSTPRSRQGGAFDNSEDRPKWFGAAF